MDIYAALLDPYLRDWLDLLLRWLHVIAAIGWIGSSFYFVLLDQSLRRPKEQDDADAGVGGELWEVHGGGFYHVKKYKVAPPELPDHLAWFKWEAYTTWISGFALMIVLYWMDAKAYMIDPEVADLAPWMAVLISAGLLVLAWVFYDLACKLIRGERALALVLIAGIAATAWGTGELYNARAAWLQTGAMIGTIMAGSVFFNIIPAHWELIRAKQDGREPDPAPGLEAKRRSVHNNYFTLPVLVTMLAGHFTLMVSHEHAWFLLLCLMALGAFARAFYNLRHGGTTHKWMPLAAALVIVIMFVMLRPNGGATETSPTDGRADAPMQDTDAARSIFSASCASCHALADAGADGTVGPDLDTVAPDVDLVRERVENGKGGMPAFGGKLTPEEIDAVSAYVADASGD